jgi:hypothetical protein
MKEVQHVYLYQHKNPKNNKSIRLLSVLKYEHTFEKDTAKAFFLTCDLIALHARSTN